MSPTFWLLLVIMEVIVVGEGLLSYFVDKRFNMFQARAALGSNVKALVFVEHGGMWGDILISFIAAYVLANYASLWSVTDIGISTGIALAFTILMLHIWKKGEFPDCLTGNGTVTTAGWVHAGYTFVALAALIGFYFFTPASAIGFTAATTISIILAIHMIAGVIQPGYHMRGLVDRGSIVQVTIVWSVLFFRWWQLTSH